MLLQDQIDLTIWDPQEDDLKKKKQYKEHFIRIKERDSSSSLEDYLNSLNIKIKAEPNKTHTKAFLKTEFIAASLHINKSHLTCSLMQQVYKFELY